MKPGQTGDLLLNLALGATAGTLATFVMDKSIEAFLRGTGMDHDLRPELLHQGSARSKANVAQNLEGEPSTMKLTQRLGQAVLDRPVTHRQRVLGGYVFHYGYGAVAGAAYGAMAKLWPSGTRGAGTAYGTFVWLMADELAISLLKLGRPPQRTPFKSHLASLVGHWAYGAALHTLHRFMIR